MVVVVRRLNGVDDCALILDIVCCSSLYSSCCTTWVTVGGAASGVVKTVKYKFTQLRCELRSKLKFNT